MSGASSPLAAASHESNRRHEGSPSSANRSSASASAAATSSMPSVQQQYPRATSRNAPDGVSPLHNPNISISTNASQQSAAQNSTVPFSLISSTPSSSSSPTRNKKKEKFFKKNISSVQTENLKKNMYHHSQMRPVLSAINVTPQRVGHGDHIFLQSKHPASVLSDSQIFRKPDQARTSAAAPSTSAAEASDMPPLSKNQLSIANQLYIPASGQKTLVIGIGLELPSRHAYDTLFNCVNKLPQAHRKKWNHYIHKPFDFSIRSSLVLYDKYGFILKGGNLMKRKESNVFEYERRRGKSDTIRMMLNKDGRCCIQRVDPDTDRVMHTRKSKTSAFLNRASIALHKVPSSVAMQMLGRSPSSQDLNSDEDNTLFVKNDTTADIEQLRIKVVDPKEIHHMVLILHYDAPMNIFVDRNCHYAPSLKKLNFLTSLMPKLRPYVRVLDAERQVEILRYYIDDLPRISVALELNRVPYKEQHEEYIQGDLRLSKPSRSSSAATEDDASDVAAIAAAAAATTPGHQHPTRKGSPARKRKSMANGGGRGIPLDRISSMRHKKVGENAFLLESPTPDSPTASPRERMTNWKNRSNHHQPRRIRRNTQTVFHNEEEEGELSDEDTDEEMEEIVVAQDEDESERYSWNIIPMKQEWQYVPKHPIPQEQILSAFLYHADLNTFGIPGHIPQLPLYWKLTIHEGRSLEDTLAYVVIGSNSIHHTQKHTTKALRSHRWDESFKCAIERGYRAGGIFLIVMKQRTFRKDTVIGKAHLNFGIIKRPYDLGVNPSITTWLPVMKGLSQHGELKVTLTLQH